MVRLTTVQIECEDNGCRSQKEKKRFHPPSAQAPNQPEPSVGHEWQAVNPEGSVVVMQSCDGKDRLQTIDTNGCTTKYQRRQSPEDWCGVVCYAVLGHYCHICFMILYSILRENPEISGTGCIQTKEEQPYGDDIITHSRPLRPWPEHRCADRKENDGQVVPFCQQVKSPAQCTNCPSPRKGFYNFIFH